ncbi:MAG TPA: hypothetical protein ENI90_07315 [Methylothermaceae bacterium]|nr:hypothetical protein [Methylothermaceae bacterium]
MTTEKQTLFCQICGKQQQVPVSEVEFICDDCGRWNPIGDARDARDRPWVAIEAQIASLTKLLPSSPPPSPEDAQRLTQMVNRIEKSLSQVRPFPGKTEIVPQHQIFVPLTQVKYLSEADLESGVTASMFTLFLGLMLQELLTQKHWTSTVTVLTLSTLVFGGYAAYAFMKSRRRKRQIMDEKQRQSVSIKLVVVEEN